MLQFIFDRQNIVANKERDLFCFGCGKNFRKFIHEYPNVKIAGIIDNYRYDEVMIVNESKIKVLSLKEFSQLSRKKSIILITPDAYEEIVKELNDDIRFEGVECCFLPFFSRQRWYLSYTEPSTTRP